MGEFAVVQKVRSSNYHLAILFVMFIHNLIHGCASYSSLLFSHSTAYRSFQVLGAIAP